MSVSSIKSLKPPSEMKNGSQMFVYYKASALSQMQHSAICADLTLNQIIFRIKLFMKSYMTIPSNTTGNVEYLPDDGIDKIMKL